MGYQYDDISVEFYVADRWQVGTGDMDLRTQVDRRKGDRRQHDRRMVERRVEERRSKEEFEKISEVWGRCEICKR